MKKRNKIGHAFSDHVFEQNVKNQKRFSRPKPLGIRSIIPLAILLIVFVLLSARLFTLEIVRASYYSRLSDENRIRTVEVAAPRGIILDRNGKALTRNIPAFSILQNKKVVFISNNTALKDMADGKNVISTVKRDYPYKDIFAHVVGYVGQVSSDELLTPLYSDYGISDFTGRMGLEEQYEKLLHGQNGKQLYEVNNKGERIRLLGEEDAKEGAVLKTTLDVNIQEAVAKAAKDVDKGAVVVSDPRNGAILALYSRPTFDPNLFTRESSYTPTGDYKNTKSIINDNVKFPLLDRAISGVYPPGSTFKLVTSIAALSSHAITEDTEIEDTGVLKIGGSTFGTWNYLESGRKEGFMDVLTAIKRSNDIFFYQAAIKTGITNLGKWAKEVGLGKKTGIDLPGEAAGIVPDPSWKEKTLGEQWFLGDTINMGIGQGYLEVTPLQVNLYTQLVANGGELFKPHLIAGNETLEKKDFINSEDLAVIRDGMKAACEPGGTGYPMFNFAVKNPNLKPDGLDYVEDASAGAGMVHVTSGCKTGTSEDGLVANPHAWFTIFAPFYNPEIVVTVLVENGGQGSDVAAPIARQILTSYFEGKKN
jgi:penicillin-binding protein 2